MHLIITIGHIMPIDCISKRKNHFPLTVKDGQNVNRRADVANLSNLA